MLNSILQNEKKCFICGKQTELDCHHCLSGSSNRKNSEEDGLKMWLCRDCHRKVHNNRDIELQIKQLAQRRWEEEYGDRQDFISRYGKSWL